MNKNSSARFHAGFTLMELLVVIAVLALLAAILFPVFAQVGIQAQRKTGDKNIRRVSLGILQYIQDNDQKFPRSGYDCRGHNGTEVDDYTAFAPGENNQCGGDGWQDVVAPYVHDASVFQAPGDKSAVGEGPWGGGMGSDFTTDDGNFSLMYNDLLAHKMPSKSNSSTDPGYADPSNQDAVANGLRITDVKTPSECLMLAEGHGGWDKVSIPDSPGAVVATDWTGSTDLHNKWHHEYSLDNFTPALTSEGYAGDFFVRIDLPFNGNGGNVAYTDGHAKFAAYSTPAGKPLLCHSLPWPKSIDPLQRGADKDSCNDPNNPLPAGWTNPNWF